jgi:hypothetical protein
MLFNNLLKRSISNRLMDNVESIQISTQSVQFGNCIYQLQNITGFEVGIIPKFYSFTPTFVLRCVQAFCVFIISISGFFYFSNIKFSIGYLALIIFVLIPAIIFLFAQFLLPVQHGLILHFNSGKISCFVCEDKRFLKEILETLSNTVLGNERNSAVIDVHIKERWLNIKNAKKYWHDKESQLLNGSLDTLRNDAIREELEAKYNDLIQAKELEIEIYRKQTDDLRIMSENLAKKPVLIDLNQSNLEI